MKPKEPRIESKKKTGRGNKKTKRRTSATAPAFSDHASDVQGHAASVHVHHDTCVSQLSFSFFFPVCRTFGNVAHAHFKRPMCTNDDDPLFTLVQTHLEHLVRKVFPLEAAGESDMRVELTVELCIMFLHVFSLADLDCPGCSMPVQAGLDQCLTCFADISTRAESTPPLERARERWARISTAPFNTQTCVASKALACSAVEVLAKKMAKRRSGKAGL
jgi:hypothetical protein